MFNNVASVNNKKPYIRPLQGLLQPLPIATCVWDHISMAYVKGLPKSYGYTILVVVDHFTKYAHLMTLKHPFTASSVASLFVKEIVRLHGFLSSIVFDCYRIFLSTFWKELFHFKALSRFVALKG